MDEPQLPQPRPFFDALLAMDRFGNVAMLLGEH